MIFYPHGVKHRGGYKPKVIIMKFTNRIISILLCVLMISAVACLSVSAKTVFPVGNWVYEKINNNTEFEIDAYNGTAATVSTVYYHNDIPITSVGSNAFDSNTTLTTINLNSTIYAVQSFAFLNCTNLTTVNFKGEVTLVDDGAFSGCSALTTINLEDTSITEVSRNCFLNCDSLTEVTLPETVTSISENAFGYCDGLTKITIPASVTTIAENAFYRTPNVVIYCYKDSTAHTYAETNSIEYVLLDAEEVETYLLGDSDDDGIITVLDATLIQKVLAYLVEDTDGRVAIRGNVNGDILSVMDATDIQKYLADIEVSYPIGETFEY